MQIVREVFGKGNQFATKITYRTRDGKPEDLLQAFRNSMYPRIVVTVDMIATGTDVKPLECLLFMRSVKSRTYFEQMVGRGVRVINDTEFQAVTDDAKTKERFIVVDAVGVMDTPLAETVQPLERKPTQSLKELFKQVAFGNKDPQVASTIAGRLARLDKHLTKDDREMLTGLAGGTDLGTITRGLVDALDPDRQIAATEVAGQSRGRPGRRRRDGGRHAHPGPRTAGHQPRTPQRDPRRPQILRADDRRGVQGRGAVRRALRRSPREGLRDDLVVPGVHRGAQGRHPCSAGALQPPAQGTADLHRGQGTGQGHRAPPAPVDAGHALARLRDAGQSKVRGSGGKMLTDIVSLVRYTLHQDDELVPFRDQVEQRYAAWLSAQEQRGVSFSVEQLQWLTWMKENIAGELGIAPESFEYTPFVEHGGIGKAVQVFGDRLAPLLNELTQALAA